jgi:putative ABC transport system substrate-binding protein
MRRREFLAALGGAGALPVASPIAAWTQERVPRIGILVAHAETDRAGQANVAAFRMGFKNSDG